MKSARTRTVALAGAALLAAGALTACSGSSDDDATAIPTASESPSPDTTSSETSSSQPSTSTSGPNSRSADAGIPADYTLPQDVAPGTCYLRLPDTYDLSDAIEVDCAQPHFVEVISTFTWPKEYVDFVADEWDNQEERCAQVAWDMGSKETGSYNWNDVKRDLIWAPSAAQLSAGEGTGYCTASGAIDSTLLVGSAVTGTLENKD